MVAFSRFNCLFICELSSNNLWRGQQMKSKKNAGRILSIALLLVFALTPFGVEAAAMETEVSIQP